MSQAWKAAERRIADKLSKWWTGTEKAFIRSPCSGGWPSARANGDMVANLDDASLPQEVKDAARNFVATWSVDVKRRIRGSRGKTKESDECEKWSLEELLTAPKHPLTKWWLEICDLAKTRGTYRFLVANKATYHSYVVLGEREMAYLKGCIQTATSQQYESWQWRKILGPTITISGVSPLVPEDLVVFELRSFFSQIDSRMLGGLGCAS